MRQMPEPRMNVHRVQLQVLTSLNPLGLISVQHWLFWELYALLGGRREFRCGPRNPTFDT
jgi:hypothetical protein